MKSGAGDKSKAPSPFAILRHNRSLTCLVGAFAGMNIAEWGYVTALSVDAFRRSGALAVGLVGLRLFVAAIGSFLSTALVHRRRPERLLLEISVLRSGLVAASAALAASGSSLGPLLALLAVDALVSAPYRPSQSALIPKWSRNPTELVASAAALSTVKTLSQTAGAAIGGALLAVTQPQTVFAGAAVIFAAAGAMVATAPRGNSNVRPQTASVGIGRLLRETATVVANTNVAALLLVSGLRTFVRGMWLAIAVIASLHLLHSGSTGVGLLMLASGIGSLVAAPLSARMISRSRIGTPAALSLAACGIPLAILAGAPVFDLALALIAAWGVGMAVADVATSSMLNRLLDSPSMPRVTSAIEATKLALEGLGAFLAPVLINLIGVRGTLLVAAIPLPSVVLSRWNLLHRVDASAGERAELLETLHRVPCLAPLDMAGLDLLIGRLTPMNVPAAGVEVVRQRDLGDRFYVIELGRAEVLIDGYRVSEIGPGDGFGERALLRDVPRTATVRSLTAMQLLVLPRKDFLESVAGYEGELIFEAEKALVVNGHTWDPARLDEVLIRMNLFSHLDSSTIDGLADKCRIDHWDTGTQIIRQGDVGDRYFVLLEGEGTVAVNGEVVQKLRPGDQFGEIALMHGVNRTADVFVASPAVTLSLHRDDFLPALRERFLSG